MDYEKSLNGLRGFAFINVLLEHYCLSFVLIPVGIYGVCIFFVLSSYLLTSILYKSFKKKKSFNLLNYFIKRILRIYPLLIIGLALEVIIHKLEAKGAVEIFFLISAKGIYWTIYIEMRAYLLIPLFVYLFAKKHPIKNANYISFHTAFILLAYIFHFF